MSYRVINLLILLVLSTTSVSAQWVVKHVAKKGRTIHDLHILPDGTGLAVGTGGFILRTDDFGESWTAVPGNINEDLYQIALFSIDTIVVRGQDKQNDGTLHRSVDGGFTWEKVYSQTYEMYSLQFFNDSIGLASGSDVIIRTTDGGNSWSTVYDIPAMTSFKVGVIWMDIASDSVAYAGVLAWQNGGQNLTRYLLKSVDMGATWEDIMVLGNDYGHCELFFYNEVFGFTDWFLPQRTQDGGMTWDTTNNVGSIADISMPSKARVYSVNHPEVYIPGSNTEFAICQSLDSGLTWQGQMEPGAHLETIHFLNDTVGFVAGEHSLIMKTEHGGGPIVGDYPWELYTSLTPEKANPIGIRIHPNPAKSMLHLSLDGEIQRWPMINVKLLRPDGKVVFSTPFATTNANMDIPVSTLPSGFYILQLTDTKGQLLGVEKVIVE